MDGDANSPGAGSPEASSPEANSFIRLIDAIRAEIAALDSEDADAIEAATAAKIAALQAVQDDIAGGVPPQKAMLEEARTLNAEAALRARAKLVSVERRLATLVPVPAKPPSLTYGRDGRWA